jgi:hypothetical protein
MDLDSMKCFTGRGTCKKKSPDQNDPGSRKISKDSLWNDQRVCIRDVKKLVWTVAVDEQPVVHAFLNSPAVEFQSPYP